MASSPGATAHDVGVVVVDDHPAVRRGLVAMLSDEPGVTVVGTAATAAAGYALVESRRPQVVIVDYNLVGEDGLSLSYRLKESTHCPKVLILSAFADDALTVMATVAGADGVINKGSQIDLSKAAAALMRGDRIFPAISPRVLEAIGSMLDHEDLPIMGMLLDGVPHGEIARTLKVDPHTVSLRRWAMLERLRSRRATRAAHEQNLQPPQ